MSLVLLGGGIVDARGSVGGNTLSRSKFGTTVRAKTSPIQPRTTFQRGSRVALQTISNGWSQVLTDSERLQWNAFALTQPQTNRFGQISYLSGQQWYNKLSNNLRIVGVGPISTPPVTGSYPGPATFIMDAHHAAGGDVGITYTGTPGVGTPKIVIYFTQCLTAGTFYVSSQLRLTAIDTASDGAHSYGPSWNIRFGNYAPFVGMKIFGLIRFVNADDGSTSAPLLASAIVT